MRAILHRWNPFASARARTARIDAVVSALERSAAAAEAERERLADAVEVSRQALLALHRALSDWTDGPARAAAATVRLEEAIAAIDARAEGLIDEARVDLRAAISAIGEATAERVAAEVAPARVAAEAHAAQLRASLDRMRGEAEALGGAQAAVASVVALSETAQGAVLGAVDALARRSAQAGDVAERAAGRLADVAERLDRPQRRVRSR